VTALPASASAYPGTDTTVDATCEATLEGLIDTTGGTWSGDLVMICDIHDDLVISLMVMVGLLSFGVGFGVVTVAIK